MFPSTSLTSCSFTVIWSLFIHEISLLVFQQCQKSIKQASKESQPQHSLLPSTQIMVCQQLLSVIHQLSVSAGLAHACWSINFYVDLSKQAECETSVYAQDTFNQLQTFSQNCSGTAGWLLSWHVQLHLISSVLQAVVKHESSDLALSGSKFVKNNSSTDFTMHFAEGKCF